ncbi:MAG: ATP-dependent RecD-like DNA helicase, partial [Streptococcaceae bacterium]|nr:ATP-dependent RecD-like DNA helicase [Streptococcaceae bacterium]
MEELWIVGTIEAVFFQNSMNFYKVMLVEITETNTDYDDDEIVVTGTVGDVTEGDSYCFKGQFTDHPKYGQQFQIETYEMTTPTSKNGLIKYLSSDKFKGIGVKSATRIVELFGENAIDEILAQPERLGEVAGLNKSKQAALLASLRENYGMEKVLLRLAEYGLGSQLTLQIYQRYKDESLAIIDENPY